jgi:predicted peptidase
LARILVFLTELSLPLETNFELACFMVLTDRTILTRMLAAAVLVAAFVPARARASELSQDDIDFRKLTYEKSKSEHLNYRLFVPLGYDSNRKYPLVLFLHGANGRGSDNIKQLTGGNQLATHFWISREVQNTFPAFVLAPQCPVGQSWSEPDLNRPSETLLLVMDALLKTEREFSVDPDRIYVAGQSMGGLAVWSLIQTYPNKWAAALVLCAYDNFSNVLGITRVPLWVFQGADDPVVPVNTVREMIQQLKKADAHLRYSEYHHVGHEVWTKAFAEPDLLFWLSSQVRKDHSAPEGQLGSGAPPAKP